MLKRKNAHQERNSLDATPPEQKKLNRSERIDASPRLLTIVEKSDDTRQAVKNLETEWWRTFPVLSGSFFIRSERK